MRGNKCSFQFEVPIKADDSLPFGYFWTKEKCFGVVKDENEMLVPFLLGDSPKRIISVLVEDIGPTRFCRFKIRGISERSVQSVEEALRPMIVCFSLPFYDH